MSQAPIPNPASIAWEGNSKEALSRFPDEVKATFGFSLRQIQNGRQPLCAHRSMHSVGEGVWELKESDARTWYRVMYLTRINDIIHVLHCFEKQSRKTDPRDIELAKARLIQVQARIRESKSGRDEVNK